MIGKKFVATALLLGTAVVVGPAAPALAGGPGDYSSCVVTVDPSTFKGGDTVTVAGTGLEPNFETTIEFNSVTEVIGTVTTDASGSFETTVTIPANAAKGAHTISAVCDAQGNISDTDVEVVVSSSGVTQPSGGPLPRTGNDVEPLVVAGGVALLAGVTFVLIAKRRRRTSSTS